jgi:hypothetical protein
MSNTTDCGKTPSSKKRKPDPVDAVGSQDKDSTFQYNASNPAPDTGVTARAPKRAKSNRKQQQRAGASAQPQRQSARIKAKQSDATYYTIESEWKAAAESKGLVVSYANMSTGGDRRVSMTVSGGSGISHSIGANTARIHSFVAGSPRAVWVSIDSDDKIHMNIPKPHSSSKTARNVRGIGVVSLRDLENVAVAVSDDAFMALARVGTVPGAVLPVVYTATDAGATITAEC